MIECPFFLVGAERSGTTLLRLMLDFHPRIACFEEFEFSVDLVGDDGSYPEMQEVRELLDQPQIQRILQNYTLDYSRAYPEFIDSILQTKRDHGGKHVIGATVHKHFDRLLSLWPDAKFVHIIRDGRDVARSRVTMGWNGNVWTAIDTWIEAEQLWDRLKRQLDESRYIEIRHESLVADVENQLARVCDFLAVEFSTKMLDYADHSTYDLPDPNLIYQWRDRATPREVQLMESKALALLVERGYKPSGLEQLNISDHEARRLDRVSIWNQRRFRMRRYGLMLTVADVLSRKVPVGPLRRYVARRIHAVSVRYIK